MVDRYKFTEETRYQPIHGVLTPTEVDNLSSAGIIGGIRSQGQDPKAVKSCQIDFRDLAQLAFEYELLRDVASTVEVEVMRVFRSGSDSVYTTQQVTQEVGHAKSSVSRALNRLAEKEQLIKVQNGVYKQIK